MARKRKLTKLQFLAHHSLSIVAIVLLGLWFVGYCYLDPQSHLGSFCGNAIADWSGSVVIILGTKFLYESGSAESRPYKAARERWAWLDFVHRHSLLLFLFVTGLGWAWLFVKMSPEGKWGQVVGNLLSEWVQMGGLVFLTKRLVEIGSKESR